jgi:transposase, IS5 family
MDAVIPWKTLTEIIAPHYPKAGNGRQPMPLERMLRIYFMHQWYGLSDPTMEDALYDIEPMRRFAGIDLTGDVVSDETTILHFRHLLEKHKLTEAIFEKTNRYLTERGVLLREGTIVDATIINAPSSTKNQNKTRDLEMKQTKKGNQWYFGMNAHVGTDTGKGLAYSIVVTNAAVHDSKVMDELLHGKEQAVYGDKAYSGKERQIDYEEVDIRWRVHRKANHGQCLTEEDAAYNHEQRKVRSQRRTFFLGD